VEDVLGGAVIGGKPVAVVEFPWHLVEVEVHVQGAEVRIDIDAFVAEPQALVQVTRGGITGAVGVYVRCDLAVRQRRPAERLEQSVEQASVGTPNALRSQLDDVGYTFEHPEHLELTVERQNRWPESHCFPTLAQKSCANRIRRGSYRQG